MKRVELALLGLGLLAQPFFGKSMASVVAPGPPLRRSAEITVEDLHPFTHYASIPAGVDPKTIRFENLKTTTVWTKAAITLNSGYCDDLQFRDPGGSMHCPYVQYESPAPAYEVTYSYRGESLASDESGNHDFTFRVYFQPQEVPAALRGALANSKVKRAELAPYFRLTASRPPVQATVLAEANSRFCAGNYVDGSWLHNDSTCQDAVSFKNVAVPSDYLTVDVEPIPSPRQTATASR